VRARVVQHLLVCGLCVRQRPFGLFQRGAVNDVLIGALGGEGVRLGQRSLRTRDGRRRRQHLFRDGRSLEQWNNESMNNGTMNQFCAPGRAAQR